MSTLSTFSPRFVKSHINGLFPSLRKTQRTNLALAVFGISKARSGILSEIARKTPGAFKHKHRLKRLWRFVSNGQVRPDGLFETWTWWCIERFVSSRYIPVALDWTTLPGNLPCLMATIPFHGRAIPLMWRIVRYADIKDSQNLIERRFVSRLVSCIPQDRRVVIIGDRGFGRATFMTFLLQKGVLFVFRVKGEVIITTSKGKRVKLKDLSLVPNVPQWFGKIAYRDDAAVMGVNLVAVVAPRSDDPWFLVTNLKKAGTTIARYETRFQIEEWFRDIKHELGLDRLKVRSLKRIRRVLFIAVVAYGTLLLIGSLADRFFTWKEQLITGRRACSRVWFALHIIQYSLAPASFWKSVWRTARGP